MAPTPRLTTFTVLLAAILGGAIAASGQQLNNHGRDDSCGPRGCSDHARSSALLFDGDGQYVLVASTDQIDDISHGLTIEAWVKPAADLPAGYRSIVSKQMNGTGYMLATNDDPRRFKAEVAGVQVTSTSRPGRNGWLHVAAVWDGQLKLYVNGQFDGVLHTAHPIANSFPLYIGSSPFGNDTTWRGAIDEVRIWAVARKQEEIQSSMNQYLCGNEAGLRAYWSFDEGRGSQLRDSAGQSDGIVVGPRWVDGVELSKAENCRPDPRR